MLTSEEILELENGLPDLASLSKALLVPFEVRRLARPSVVWINQRWFLERGFNPSCPGDRSKINTWILSQFAFVVADSPGLESALSVETAVFFADRYGSTDGMSPHGGSGRVATVGRFQAKGIGVTPLVGVGAHQGHSHGCISVAECLREAIYAEIASEEFPHGAVPVLAIVDTGINFCSPDRAEVYDQETRRGILVRPAAIRIAHVERAPLFLRAAKGGHAHQSLDLERTRDVAQRWADESNIPGMTMPFISPRRLVKRVAEQAAFGSVHRLFNGGYFSSNLGVLGELLDFGNMHVFPNWACAKTLPHVPGFGQETSSLLRIASSIAFFLNKFRWPSVVIDEQELQAALQGCYADAWERYWLDFWGVPKGEGAVRIERALLAETRSFFSQQQRTKLSYRFGLPDRHTSLLGAGELYAELKEMLVENRASGSRLTSDLYRMISSGRRRLFTPLRYLKARSSIDRAELIKATCRMTKGTFDEQHRQELQSFVDTSVADARRCWRRLPTGLAVHRYSCFSGSSVLYCERERDGAPVIWLEGPSHRGLQFLWGQPVPTSFLGEARVVRDGRKWSAVLPLTCGKVIEDGVAFTLRRSGEEINGPPLSPAF